MHEPGFERASESNTSLPDRGRGPGQQLIQRRTAKEPAVEYDRLNVADIANVDHRVGVEEDKVRQLADGDAAGLVLAAQDRAGAIVAV